MLTDESLSEELRKDGEEKYAFFCAQVFVLFVLLFPFSSS